LAESSGLDLDYEDEESDFRKTNFPGRYIYERVLPQIVKKHSDLYYHRGSPYSGHGKLTTDQTYGDLHQWNVWHGSQEPWHNWNVLSGRFVSEFGMLVAHEFQRSWHSKTHWLCRQAYPNIRTVDYWTGGDVPERYPQSRYVHVSFSDRSLK
jgi:beta-mannosidase